MVGTPGARLSRKEQRLETRERVYEAAVAEFEQRGMEDADIGAIAEAAGVSRGTFYFHFSTKEHLLAELERREQERLVNELARFATRPHDLASFLHEVVRQVVALDRRLGNVLFRDMLALHFSPKRPYGADWSNYKIIVLVVEEIERARDAREVTPDIEPQHAAFFFLIGLYAVLITSDQSSKRERTAVLEGFVRTALTGLQPR